VRKYILVVRGGKTLNLNEIKNLIDMLDGTDIIEFNVEDENNKVKIKRGYQSLDSIQHKIVNKEKESELENDNDDMEEIVAPMVGTFYRAPAPDADSFVEIGDIIKPGDTLCIIEAMKLMNEIEAETKGKITEVLVDNAEAVEYGQPLFRLELL